MFCHERCFGEQKKVLTETTSALYMWMNFNLTHCKIQIDRILLHCGNPTLAFTVISGNLISNCMQTPEIKVHALV